MIERVAKEIASSMGDGWTFDEGNPEFDSSQTKHYRESYRRAARAAIEAMREPTAAMVDVYLDLEPMDDDRGYNPPAAIPAWQAMIDAALTACDIPTPSPT